MIWYWPYELKPRRSLGALAGNRPRQGALIRAGEGFADVHPWPELGHLPLDRQLELLARGQTTPLTACSLRLARFDGEARSARRSLFDGLRIPESHFLITDSLSRAEAEPIWRAGFRKVKVKCGPEINTQARELRDLVRSSAEFPLKLRLDFNETLSAGPLGDFLDAIGDEVRARIDFLEDPTPYAANLWQDLSSRYRCRFAADQVDPQMARAGAAVFVIKPAVRNEEPILPIAQKNQKEVVFTSSMDHPVGQLGAAFIAARAAASLPDRVSECGLLTHELYERTAFSERIEADGPRLRPPGGTGVGFDDLLEKLPWSKLA